MITISGQYESSMPSVAYLDDNLGGTSTTFYNLCGVLKVKLKGNGVQFQTVRLTSNEAMSGDFDVAITGALSENAGDTWKRLNGCTLTANTTANSCLYTFDNAQNLSATEVQKQVVYITVPPGTYTDFTITIGDANGNPLHRPLKANIPIVVQRNRVLDLGEVDLGLYFAGSQHLLGWCTANF